MGQIRFRNVIPTLWPCVSASLFHEEETTNSLFGGGWGEPRAQCVLASTKPPS